MTWPQILGSAVHPPSPCHCYWTVIAQREWQGEGCRVLRAVVPSGYIVVPNRPK